MNKKRENPLINIGCNIALPAIILSKFSDDGSLGQTWALIVALAFPLGYGLWDWLRIKKLNIFSALGLISTLMTGGIGLFALSRNWMIAKETGIPFILGTVVLLAQWRGKSLISVLFSQIIDLDKIDSLYREKGAQDIWKKQLTNFSYMMGGTFFISAALNFFLAILILKGEPGSVEFNKSLGKMTALSYPVIALPMMAITVFIFWKLFRNINQTTSLKIEELLKN